MVKKDFLSLIDLDSDQISFLLSNAINIKNSTIATSPLKGKVLALIFQHPSLRTRVSFEIGIRKLGGDCFYLDKSSIQIGERESVEDIAKVLDRWVDGIIVRIPSPQDLIVLAQNTNVPVINAMTDAEHPCQTMADLLTILEHKKTLKGITVAFIGDGNNVASSLAIGCSSVGANFTLVCPPGYEIPKEFWNEASNRASKNESTLSITNNPLDINPSVDVIYTDVWISMGQEKEAAKRRESFGLKYQVNNKLLDSMNSNTIFMHDMPAHEGEEIAEGILNHSKSVVFDQSENRLYAQMSIMDSVFQTL
jgi:ornithine carbamoyltransferase